MGQHPGRASRHRRQSQATVWDRNRGPGTYNITMTAINYYGSDTETLVLDVVSTFANTKSINFNNNDYLSCSAFAVSPVLGRTGNGPALRTHGQSRYGSSREPPQIVARRFSTMGVRT